jgi:hypothetical protein
MKNSIDTIGNRTRDLPAQPTAPPSASKKIKMRGNYRVCETYFLMRGGAKFTNLNMYFIVVYKNLGCPS